MNLSVLQIERALVLMDPIGLIRMGAPLDEYSPEAEEIYRSIRSNFSDDQILEVLNKTIKKNFGVTPKLSYDQQKLFISLLKRNAGLQNTFFPGKLYNVTSFSEFIVRFEFGRLNLFEKDYLLCLDKTSGISKKNVIFLTKVGIIEKTMEVLEEIRFRWFFEEI